MKLIKSKKAIVLLVTLVVVAAAAIGAYAYFTSTGTGTGNATVGSSSAFVVTETAQAGGPLYPDPASGPGHGANVQTNTYTVNNPSTGNQNYNQTVISVAGAGGSTWYACAGDATVNGTSHLCENGTNPAGLLANGQAACRASDFSVGDQTAGSPWTDTANHGDLAAGATVTSHVTVELIDNGANQDACQGVTAPLFYSAS